MTGEYISGNFNVKDTPVFPAPKPTAPSNPSTPSSPLSTTDLPNLPGFPVVVTDLAGTPVDRFLTAPAVVDLDGDGLQEIIVGGNVLEGDHYVAKLFCYNSDGSRRWVVDLLSTDPSVTSTFSNWGYKNIGTPSVGDINGDGQLEIVIMASDASSQNKVFAFDRTGALLPSSWPVDVAFGMLNPNNPDIVLSDINGDLNDEIIVGSGVENGNLYCLSETGSNLPGFPFISTGDPLTGLAVGRVNADTDKKIIAVTFTGRINVLSSSGAVISTFSVPIIRESYRNGKLIGPLLVDPDFDGISDIFVAEAEENILGLENYNDFGLYSYAGDGSLKPGYPTWGYGIAGSMEGLSAGRFGSDNQIKILASTGNYIAIINAIDGRLTAINPITQAYNEVHSADLDGDSWNEILFGSVNYGTGTLPTLWSFKSSANYLQTSLYSGDFPASGVNGYRAGVVADLDNDGLLDYLVSYFSIYYGASLNAFSFPGALSTYNNDWACRGFSVKRENNFQLADPGASTPVILPSSTWVRSVIPFSYSHSVSSSPELNFWIGDINVDGQKEVLISYDYRPSGPPFITYYLETIGSDGKDLSGWPHYVHFTYGSPYFRPGIAVGNFDPSPELEIAFIGPPGLGYSNLQCVNYLNEPVFYVSDHINYQNPFAFDLDDDGLDEITVIAQESASDPNLKLYFYDGDSSVLREPIPLGISDPNGSFAYAIDDFGPGLGKKIVLTHQNSAVDPNYIVKVIDYATGTSNPAFDSISIPGSAIKPTICDLDNDGIKEIIIGNYNKFWIYRPDGTLVSHCPLEGLDGDYLKILVDDLRDGSEREIYAPSYESGTTALREISGYDHAGNILSGFPTPIPWGYECKIPFITADVYDDSLHQKEILVGFQDVVPQNNFYVLRANGAWVSSAPVFNPYEFPLNICQLAAYSDIDNNGIGNLIVSGWNNQGPLTYSIELPLLPEPIGIHESATNHLPTQPSLLASPNPFNSHCAISYKLTEPGEIELAIYNLLGQKIKTLDSGYRTKEEPGVIWNATNEENKEVPSGVYFCRLTTKTQNVTKKLVFLK